MRQNGTFAQNLQTTPPNETPDEISKRHVETELPYETFTKKVHTNQPPGRSTRETHLPREAIKHEIGRMTIPESQDVANHAHHGKRARVARAPLQPRLAIL